jgi:hypothetical protein
MRDSTGAGSPNVGSAGTEDRLFIVFFIEYIPLWERALLLPSLSASSSVKNTSHSVIMYGGYFLSLACTLSRLSTVG